MPRNIFRLACLLFIVSIGVAAEPPGDADGNPDPSGFEWLRQFEGEWSVVSTSPGAENMKATVSSHTIGNNWIVNQHSSPDAFGTGYQAVQTLGYDAEKKKYVGSWIDSMMGFKWTYSGTLDESGKRLLLDTEGPDMANPEEMKKYRDVYEIKSKDEILAESQMLNAEGKWAAFMSSTLTRQTVGKEAAPQKVAVKEVASPKNSKTTITPFLMFIGKAEAAIEFYKTVFPNLEIESMVKYGAGQQGKEGTVKLATFVVAGQRVKCIDSPPVHDFDFTPSFSFFVECESEEQLKERFAKLSDGGKIMMPVDNYGFSTKFAWTSDKFGVSWQLNLQ